MSRRPVYFADYEKYLEEHADKQNNNFSAYVKELIKKDIEGSSLEDRLKAIETILLNTEIKKQEHFNPPPLKNENDYNNDDKADLLGFLNMEE